MKTRKILSAFLGLSMALSSLVIPAYADGETNLVIGTVSGEAVAYGETLNVKENGTAVTDSVRWLRVEGDNEVSVGTGATYIVTEADMGYQIKATRLNDEATPVEIADMYKYTFSTNWTYKTDAEKGWSVEKDSKEKALFRLKNSDKTFVLAKTFNNDKSKYFVVANDSYGKRKLNSWDESLGLTPKFDPTIENDNNMAYWLNNKFPTEGLNGNKLPEGIVNYIDFEHIWKTEGTSVWKQNKLGEDGKIEYQEDEKTAVKIDRENMTSYTFKAGVTLPSMTELVTYENIGYSVDCSNDANRWHVRTPVDHDNVNAYQWSLAVFMYLEDVKDSEGNVKTNNAETRKGARTSHDKNPEFGVRPEFYLKDGFFANVAIDLASAGEDVKAEIKKQDESALRNLYSDDELKNYLGIINETATIEIATVSGETAAYGETLKATVNGEEVSVNWTRVENGTSTVVGTGKTYIVTEADMGCWLNAVVGNAHSESVSIATIYTKTFSTNNGYNSVKADSAAEALFKLKDSDRQFVLVKTFNNDESKYFVVANDGYGKREMATNKTITLSDNTTVTLDNKHDPTIKHFGNFAYWINEVFPKDGVNWNNEGEYEKLPEKIGDWINFNHIWRTEEAAYRQSYTFTAGITIPSMTELQNYSNKLGYSITLRNGETGLNVRTPENYGALNSQKWGLQITMNGVYGSTETSTDTYMATRHSENPNSPVRPEFYLKKGFFANVAIDLATAGADVIAEIKKEKFDDLRKIYSISELTTLGFDASAYPAISTVSGEAAAYGETLTSAVPTGATASDLVWKVDGTVINVTGNQHIVTEGNAGKTISVEYTKNGTVYADSVEIPALLNDTVEPNSTVNSLKDSPNTFTVGGQEFAIIADFNNSESTFFVAANQTYGKIEFSASDQTMENVTDSLINWLNDEDGFKGGEVEGEHLPESITKYIVEHEWLMEAAPKATIACGAKTFTAGISLPSVSEFKRYNTTFGWCINPQTITNDNGAESWNCTKYWTRTPANYSNERGKQYQYVAGVPTNNTYNNFNVSHWDLPSSTYLRPVFYLSEDFFREVAVDNVPDMFGNKDILAMLTKRYTANEMVKLYGEEFDIETLVERYGFVRDGVEVTFTDKDGGALTALNGATSLKANISVSSSKKSFKGVAILALYDGDGALKNVGTVDLDATATGSDSKAITFAELSDVDAGYTAKVMFWDSIAGMKSISDKVMFGTEVTGATSLAFAEKAESDNSIGGYNFF